MKPCDPIVACVFHTSLCDACAWAIDLNEFGTVAAAEVARKAGRPIPADIEAELACIKAERAADPSRMAL